MTRPRHFKGFHLGVWFYFYCLDNYKALKFNGWLLAFFASAVALIRYDYIIPVSFIVFWLARNSKIKKHLAIALTTISVWALMDPLLGQLFDVNSAKANYTALNTVKLLKISSHLLLKTSI